MSIFSSCTVLIGDPKNPEEIEEWCRNQPDFISVIETDVSDVSTTFDIVYAYCFANEEATTWFKLRWQ